MTKNCFWESSTSIYIYVNNLREKYSSGLGFEPGSPALRAGAITTKLPRRSTGPCSSYQRGNGIILGVGWVCERCTQGSHYYLRDRGSGPENDLNSENNS